MEFLLASGLHIYYLNFHLVVCAYAHCKLLRYRQLYFLLCISIFLLPMSLALQCAHNMLSLGTSLAAQRLRLHTSTAGGEGSIPGRGIKILHAVRWCGQKKIFLMLSLNVFFFFFGHVGSLWLHAGFL